jgi:predicted AlkP superfamily phosphohydrolase/phosphomutase
VKFFTKKNKKALVIGIDGLPRELLIRLIEKGILEGVKTILNTGYLIHPMHASLPEISSVSWTSFMTGRNPAEHGIFGFTHLQPGSYQLHFTNSKDIKAPTFWQILSRTGKVKKALILNLPNTYPAFPINGLLVSGFVAIDFEKAVYPSSYIPFLKKLNYIIDVDAEKARKDKPALYQDILQSLSTRGNVSRRLFDQEPWDLFLLCITETDRLHHFFFDEKDTTTFEKVYKQIDRIIVDLYQTAKKKWGEEFLFIIVSDHGFSLLIKEVNLNAYLNQQGMLIFDLTKDYYERISPGTSAFAMDPGRIYIHYEKKFPRGTIRPDEGKQIKEKLKQILLDLRDANGEPVIRSIFEKEEIYQGPYLEDAPDLLCIPHSGYDLKGNVRKEEIFTVDIFKGMHTWDNAVLVSPAQIGIDSPINIEFPAKIIIDYYS